MPLKIKRYISYDRIFIIAYYLVDTGGMGATF